MKYKLTLICAAAALNTAAVMMTSAVLQVSFGLLQCAAIGTGFTLLFLAIRRFFKFVGVITGLMIVIVAALAMWYFEIIDRIFTFFIAYADWIYYYDLASPDPESFGILISLVLAGAVSALISTPFVAVKPFLPIPMLFYSALIFAPFALIDMDQYFIAVNIAILAMLTLVMLTQYARMSARYGEKLRPAPYQLIGIPLCALAILLSQFLPWNTGSRMDLVPSEVIESFRNVDISLFKRPYHLNETGHVVLGNRHRPGVALLFEMETVQPFYMYAECYDEYTGGSWMSTRNEPFPYYELRFNSTLFKGESKEESIGVLYRNLSTDILLVPRQFADLQIQGEYSLFTTRDSVLRVSPEAEEGMRYSLNAQIPDLGTALAIDMILYDMIIGSENYDSTYAQLIASSRFSMEEGGEGLSDFLQLPDTVTERTRELALEITADKDSYVEKAKAIQDYLAENYPYSLDPPALPNDADFVDHFLFEAKTGYCTSYASAMTVMLRTLGIAARYCEGFAPNVSNYQNGMYQVYESDAHAWVEMYALGIGWVEFDPTGTENARAYRNNAMPTPTPPPAPVIPEITPEPEPSPSPSPSPTPPRTTELSAENTEIPLVFKIITAILIAVLLPFAWLYGSRLYVSRTLAVVKRKTPTEQMKFWSVRLMSLLRSEGLAREQFETLRQFIMRVQVPRPSSGIDLLPAIVLLEKTLYNGEDINWDELEVFLAAYAQLSSGFHAGWGRRRQWWETNVTLRLLWHKLL